MTGTERLSAAFSRARDSGSRALVTYLCAGDPHPAETVGLVEACIEGGADVIELGVPFSDPTADGPVIQAASQRALSAGTRVDDVLSACRALADRHPHVPIVLFGYWNPWHTRGPQRTAEIAAQAGASGLLVVDLPPEESGALDAASAQHGLARIFLVAPTTGPARLEAVANRSTGFIYLVSLRGVTGSELSRLGEVRSRVEALRAVSGLPVAVGFGVDGPGRAAELAAFSDGVVVGTALVREVRHAADAAARRVAARDFTAVLKASLSR